MLQTVKHTIAKSRCVTKIAAAALILSALSQPYASYAQMPDAPSAQEDLIVVTGKKLDEIKVRVSWNPLSGKITCKPPKNNFDPELAALKCDIVRYCSARKDGKKQSIFKVRECMRRERDRLVAEYFSEKR